MAKIEPTISNMNLKAQLLLGRNRTRPHLATFESGDDRQTSENRATDKVSLLGSYGRGLLTPEECDSFERLMKRYLK